MMIKEVIKILKVLVDMKAMDTGKDKVKKICDVLKRETLDPAKKEADAIIHKAREEGHKIVEEAKREAKRIEAESKKKIDEERNVFRASMNLACKKSLSSLKQDIEEKLFHPQVATWIKNQLQDPQVIASLISAIVRGIEKEGIEVNLEALIPRSVSVKKICEELIKGIADRLGKNPIQIGDFDGGAQVRIVDQNMTLDMSENALKALVVEFVRDEFRAVFFGK